MAGGEESSGRMEAVEQEIRWHTKKLGSEVIKYVRGCMDIWLEGLEGGQEKYEVLRWGLEVMHLALGDSSVLSLPWVHIQCTGFLFPSSVSSYSLPPTFPRKMLPSP